MDNGDKRILNLELLINYAENYEAMGGSGLSGFIRYLDKIRSSKKDLEGANELTENDDASIEKAETLIMNEVQRLIDGEVSEYELTRTINRFESNFMFSSMGFMAKAQSLANYVMHNEDINDVVNRYRKVTVDDIARVAREIFVPEKSSTLIYRPQK